MSTFNWIDGGELGSQLKFSSYRFGVYRINEDSYCLRLHTPTGVYHLGTGFENIEATKKHAEHLIYNMIEDWVLTTKPRKVVEKG